MSEAIDISKIEDQKRLAESISIDIDEWCAQEYDDGHRNHLGGSMIGSPCSRQLYYSFRWVKKADYNSYDSDGNVSRHAGQVMRLFQRGHKEEFSFIQYLEGIGCKLDATPETQLKISDVGGHFGGSLDNTGLLPERYGVTEKLLFEFKTMNMSYFNKLKSKERKNEGLGILEAIIPKAQPKYWAQVCVYGFKAGIKYVFFMVVDKNTDALHIEIIPLDFELAKSMLDKAAMIVTTKVTPPRISMHRTHLECKWCNYTGICFDNEALDKNCRSCQHSEPVEGGKWECQLVRQGDKTIPDHVIPVGCPQYIELVQIK